MRQRVEALSDGRQAAMAAASAAALSAPVPVDQSFTTKVERSEVMAMAEGWRL
jgi:hypothetical protein